MYIFAYQKSQQYICHSHICQNSSEFVRIRQKLSAFVQYVREGSLDVFMSMVPNRHAVIFKVFNKYGGDRPLVDDILVLFTDGNAHDLPLARDMATAMKNRKIKIVGIAAGTKDRVRQFKGELENLVTNREDIISVDFPDLATFATKLLRLTCD